MDYIKSQVSFFFFDYQIFDSIGYHLSKMPNQYKAFFSRQALHLVVSKCLTSTIGSPKQFDNMSISKHLGYEWLFYVGTNWYSMVYLSAPSQNLVSIDMLW